MATQKGFIKNWVGDYILPITRGELVLDSKGNIALQSNEFLAGGGTNGDLPGLMTAAEKAMLSGTGTGGGIADIYTKLGYINNGIKFNNSTYNFYDTNNKATPINILTAANQLTLTPVENSITLGLHTINSASIEKSEILKGIKVDVYGRVTEVTSGKLLNTDIPDLDGQKISNATLSGCTTEFEAIDETKNTSIVNKAYVDKKIDAVTGIATGALKFDGPLDDGDTAKAMLGNKNYYNCYYKVVGSGFNIAASDLYNPTEGSSGVFVKAGDTLIIYPTNNTSKFVYIPSGNDTTLITIREEGQTATVNQIDGSITIQFSQLFNVEPGTSGSDNRIAKISMPQANASQDGYLSQGDWVKFNSYGDSLAVTYTSSISTQPGQYKIGEIKIGSNDPVDVIGLNNVTTLALIADTTTPLYNPILEFTETGLTESVKIAYKGFKGIQVKKNGNDVEFYADNKVVTESANYLEISEGHQFKVKLGSAKANGELDQEGLVPYSEFNSVANAVTLTTIFESITNSLTDTTKSYHYGSDDLLKAIGGKRADGTVGNWTVLTI